MGRQGAETRLVKAMRDAGAAKYGSRLVTIKYHGNAYSEAGVSDLLCCIDGVFVAVEVKAPASYGGSVTRAIDQGTTVKQLAFLNRVADAGGVAVVCATVEQFLDVLDQTAYQGQEEPNG